VRPWEGSVSSDSEIRRVCALCAGAGVAGKVLVGAGWAGVVRGVRGNVGV